MAGYWWGDKDDSKKLHWANWEKLAKPKEAGGLDFKNLETVNESLLAKQLWRLIKEPQLLMSRVLKGRYYPHRELLETQMKGSDSWLWKSWLGAKDTLQAGLRWRVVDGRSIKIWEDKWLPHSIGAKVLSRPPEHCQVTRVKELIADHGGCWNQQLVEHLFNPQEAKQILQIPLSHSGCQDQLDQLDWIHEKHGKFSVSSAYKLIQQVNDGKRAGAETSKTRADHTKMWRTTWQLPVKPKLKHFMWKCVHGWLATNSALIKRGMMVDVICHRCGLAPETLEHIFFHCREAELIWKISPVKWDIHFSLIDSFTDWWQTVSNTGGRQSLQQGLAFTVYLLWHIWKARNAWQFQGLKLEAHEIVLKASNEWNEYEAGARKNRTLTTNKPIECNTLTYKQGGPAGVIRIYVTAEFSHVMRSAGFGYLFRDDQGAVTLAKADVSPSILSPCTAELEAIRRALLEAQSRRVQSLEILLDEKTMVAWLQGKTPPVSEALSIVSDIFLLKSHFVTCRFLYIHRKWNLGSHVLANWALSSGHPQLWEENYPQWLERTF